MTVKYYGGLSSQRQVLRRKLEKVNHPVIRKEKARYKRKNSARAMKAYVQMALKGEDPTKMKLSKGNMKRAQKAKRLVAKHKKTKITAKQKSARRKNIAIARRLRKKGKRK